MIKFAIAGFGKMGKIREASIIENANTCLVAAYESGEYDPVTKAVIKCSSFDELLEQDIDALFVCAFNNVAAQYTIKALNKGIHVFCEKPPARDCQELALVLKAEKESGLTLKYGFNHRLHYSVQQAKKIIDSGEMGKPLWIRGVYGKAGSIDYHKNWRNYKQYSSGGILMDQGIHMLDLFHFLLDRKFDVISSQLSTSFWDIEVEDNAFVTLQSDQLIATLHSSATQWRHKFLLEMCFENGFINLDGILSDSRSYAPETLVLAKREFEDITFAMGKPAENVIWFENDDSWKLELEEFITALQSGKPVVNGTSQDAFNVLSLVENIYQQSGFYHEG